MVDWAFVLVLRIRITGINTSARPQCILIYIANFVNGIRIFVSSLAMTCWVGWEALRQQQQDLDWHCFEKLKMCLTIQVCGRKSNLALRNYCHLKREKIGLVALKNKLKRFSSSPAPPPKLEAARQIRRYTDGACRQFCSFFALFSRFCLVTSVNHCSYCLISLQRANKINTSSRCKCTNAYNKTKTESI